MDHSYLVMNFIALPNSISLLIAHVAHIKKAVQTVKRPIKKATHDGNLPRVPKHSMV